mmetsp:Transcript_78902/g.218291  ORF Transcript_78902/g.218291 Transcript_78902/m.218291 type:complete len:435 (+) Transcript_78902:43-1347(+)|eukprot:CAMPEP_0179024310 /NCGR_PEP_ID=MMETSP0796-20121207/7388_1 /TAXON_ID=73915 /ORGANISM="Pyrodinium bahamense, Strain pbaha01" /LENGTH=434 /DNA_ID=CAMNT_0020720265 /DNA_START=43 /DNA_END=1347 /DNA_ORIENTATION=-
MSHELTGTVARDNGRFGFIRLADDGTSDMFVMPKGCAAFGGVIPRVGTKVRFSVVSDEKTGWPRAENVEPEEHAEDWAPPQTRSRDAVSMLGPPQHAFMEGRKHSGTVVNIYGTFGFIRQDNGGADMFIMPASCAAFGGQLPAVGTRIRYAVVTDERTGRPRADGVEPAGGTSPALPPARGDQCTAMAVARPPALSAAGAGRSPDAAPRPAPHHSVGPWAGRRTGAVLKAGGGFGFIQQDCGEADMFVMPAGCAAFGSEIPPVGTRVSYVVVADAKTGRPRADAVQPLCEEDEVPAAGAAAHSFDPSACRAQGVAVSAAVYGPVRGGKGGAWRNQPYVHWGGKPATALPSVTNGTRRVGSVRVSGTMAKDNGSFGFIALDSGGADMFVMPAACAAFGGVLPPLHSRLEFDVVIDAKTGRPRAEDVVPVLAGSIF